MARKPYSQIRGPGPGHWEDRQAVRPLNRFLARALEKQGGMFGGDAGGEACDNVSSTAINAIDYRNGRLFVTFNSGRKYTYFDVSPEQYRAFCEADSKGRFFNRVIRDKYAYARNS